MTSTPMHQSQETDPERRANRRIWIVTLLTTGVI